eukprot:2844915-Prymnesium_polylepis.1
MTDGVAQGGEPMAQGGEPMSEAQKINEMIQRRQSARAAKEKELINATIKRKAVDMEVGRGSPTPRPHASTHPLSPP